jgi:hypothetical protein
MVVARADLVLARSITWPSETRVHRFALERQHAEHAFMDTEERFASGESLERFDAERELAGRE